MYQLLSFNLHLLLYTAFFAFVVHQTEALKYMLKVQLTFFLSVKTMFHLIQMRKGAGGQLRRGPYLGFLFFSRRKKNTNPSMFKCANVAYCGFSGWPRS